MGWFATIRATSTPARARSGAWCGCEPTTTASVNLVAVVAAKYDGKPLNQPNDLALDGQGGLYFTDPNYRRDEPAAQPRAGGLLRVGGWRSVARC